MDSNGDGMVSQAITDSMGTHDVFVAVGQPSAASSVVGTADSKGRAEGTGSDVYGRSESSETQPMGASGMDGESGGVLDMDRENGMAITTKADKEADDSGKAGSGADLPSPPGLLLASRTPGEGSTTPGTDVE